MLEIQRTRTKNSRIYINNDIVKKMILFKISAKYYCMFVVYFMNLCYICVHI